MVPKTGIVSMTADAGTLLEWIENRLGASLEGFYRSWIVGARRDKLCLAPFITNGKTGSLKEEVIHSRLHK